MDDLDRKLYKILSKENIEKNIALLKEKLAGTTDETEQNNLKSQLEIWEEFLNYGERK